MSVKVDGAVCSKCGQRVTIGQDPYGRWYYWVHFIDKNPARPGRRIGRCETSDQPVYNLQKLIP